MSFSGEVLKKYGIRLKKKYGQNFLVDERVVNKIIDGANLSKQDLVFEIGPGVGVLTKELGKKAGRVIAVEIDQSLIEPLKNELSSFSNIEIVHEDALRFDFTKKANETCQEFSLKSVKVVANLPYYITTPLIMMFLEKEKGFCELNFMVQREVALRMVAKASTKDYGMLTLAVSYYAKATLLFDVSPASFIPRPDVTSSVIRLGLYENPPVAVLDEKLLFRLIKASFSHRRKTLLNCLFHEFKSSLSKDEIGKILEMEKIPPSARGETLTLEDFANLSNVFFKHFSAFE